MAEITDEIKLNRVKQASEAYRELKAIEGEMSLATLLPREAGDEPDDVNPSIPTWQEFRDAFIADWDANRIILTDKEADAMFEKDVNDALDAIEAGEQTALETGVAAALNDTGVSVTTTPPATSEGRDETTPAPVAKKRGRPAGKKSVKAVVKAKKAVAKSGKKATSASAKAQTIIAKYVARDWARKDVIQKLQDQLGMGAAYAATLYQKFA